MIQFIGFALIFLTYFLIDSYFKQKRNKKKYNLPDSIKLNYYEIKVPSNKIEILTNQYIEEVEVEGPMKIKAIDALYNNNRNFIREQKYASTLIYLHSYKGKTLRLHSETIDLNEKELKSIINSKGIVSVYYDKANINNYYFDLSFISN